MIEYINRTVLASAVHVPGNGSCDLARTPWFRCFCPWAGVWVFVLPDRKRGRLSFMSQEQAASPTDNSGIPRALSGPPGARCVGPAPPAPHADDFVFFQC